MDKLVHLKEWQQKQEQVLKQSQHKQILLSNEQKTKSSDLTDRLLEKSVIKGKEDCLQSDISPHYDNNREPVQVNKDESTDEIKSLESQTSRLSCQSYLESSPVIPGIDGKKVKTFEELLNIRLNDERNINNNNNNDSNKTPINCENKPKKPFLRKGEGIKRFDGSKKSNSKKPRLVNDDKKVSFESYVKRNSVKETRLNENKTSKTEQKPLKQINRKVIPLTTKLGPKNSKHKDVIISRDSTSFNNEITDEESAFFDYLEYVCGNISLDSSLSSNKQNHSFDDKLKDKDINELQTLLKKIELKKNKIQKKLDENNSWVDMSDEEDKAKSSKKSVKKVDKPKKKVRWSQNTSKLSQNIKTTKDDFDDDDDDDKEEINLNKPKSGAYSLSLKQQITELENRVSDLKLQSVRKEKVTNDPTNRTLNDVANSISDEVNKLKDQIDILNKRLMSIESKSYDFISPQIKEIRNSKQNIKSKSKYNFERIASPNNRNVSVSQNLEDTTVELPNGDKMKISKDNTVFYTFTNGATQTTYPDGLKIVNFPNGQIEKMHKNGVKHITYTNGLQRIIHPDSSEEVIMQDNTIWRIHSDGTESLEFANGDREIRTDKYKRREYSNGNVKTLYSDGTVETRYVNGRIRIKDRLGNLIVDSLIKHLNDHIPHS